MLPAEERSRKSRKMFFPNFVTSTDRVGRAMIRVGSQGYSRPHLENRDINALTG